MKKITVIILFTSLTHSLFRVGIAHFLLWRDNKAKENVKEIEQDGVFPVKIRI